MRFITVNILLPWMSCRSSNRKAENLQMGFRLFVMVFVILTKKKALISQGFFTAEDGT